MWGSLEDNRELRKVVLKGRGLDSTTNLEGKHESRACLSEGLVFSCVDRDSSAEHDRFCCAEW